MSKIQNVKGCFDYLPEKQTIRDYINEKLKETFKEFGYLPIETSILCYNDMLVDKYDENNDLVKEIYKLSDQGNRKLGLRYDLTVPFAKFITLNKNQISLPFKRYEIAKVFRDGPVKVGRDREFTQCDCDVVGLSGQMIEAECLNLYVNAFNKLEIDIIIKYNSRNLMQGLIIESDIAEEQISKVITIIDKLDKVTKEEFNNMLKDIGIKEKSINKLQELFTLNLEEITKKYQNTNIEVLKKGIAEVNNLKEYLIALDIEKYTKFSPTLARGQDYYTGNVFEVYEANNKLTSSIGAGGRYDNMITNFINDGNQYPAVGISFGLTSIYELLKDKIIDNNLDLYIIPMETEKQSLILANKLRQKNIKVSIEMNKRKVKKCFEWANKNNINYVCVIGDNEIENKTIKLKNMKTAKEIEINIEDINKISSIIKNNE